ncbi:MAG TPA: hypothetical protein VGD37_28190 [Kofleriaceae bacterium]|jgi:hypothetical protein
MVVLAIGLCVVVYWSVRTAVGIPTADSSPARRADDPAQPFRAAARQPAPAPPRAQGQRPPGVDSAGSAPQEPVIRDPRNDPEARAEGQRKYRAYIAGVEAAFRKEATDPRWSSATSGVVQAALASDDELRPLARGVECRARTCRVEIAEDTSGRLGKLLPVFAQQVAQELPVAVVDRVQDPGGGTKMILYMSRRDDAQAMTP